MKVAVIVTGVLRNFEVAMSNWQWPEGCDVDYFMVTWDLVTTNYFPHSKPEPVWAAVEKAAKILPFQHIRIFNSNCIPVNYMNYAKMLFMWKQAALLAKELNGYDSYIIVRPDLIMVPHKKLTSEFQRAIDPRPNKIIGQIDTLNFMNCNDLIVCFSKSAADGVERLYDLLLANIHAPVEQLDIHSILARLYRLLKESGICIQSGFIEEWYLLVGRRPAFPGKLNSILMRSEISHTLWFLEHQIHGGHFEGGVDPNSLYYG